MQNYFEFDVIMARENYPSFLGNPDPIPPTATLLSHDRTVNSSPLPHGLLR